MSASVVQEPVTAEAIPDDPPPQGSSCPSCGAPYEPMDQFCTACGQAVESVAAAPAIVEAEVIEQKHFRCKNCGSEVAMDIDTRSYTCAFCDSTYVVEFSANETPRQPPEFVIGFGVTREMAEEKFHKWFATNSWFRPGDLQSATIERKLRGIYMPFWAFSMLAKSRWSASIGEFWYRTETYTTRENGKTVTKTRRVRETEWWQLSGRHHKYYSGYLVSGSRGLSQAEADRIKPFHLPALKRYKPFFLAGWLSEEYSVARNAALEQCKQFFYQHERQNVAAFLPGDTHRQLQVSTRFSNVNSDLILLPVYLLAYRYQDKLYRFMVNGQTGKVVGEKPLSWKRIGVAIGIAVGVIAAIAGIVLLLQNL